MRTEQGKAFIQNLALGQWVTRGQIYEMFGTQREFRKQVAEFRPDLVTHLGAKCTKRGMEVREHSRVVEVAEHLRDSVGRMAASQAVKVSAVDPSRLSDALRRAAERAVGFFSATAVAAANKALRGDIGARLLGGVGGDK